MAKAELGTKRVCPNCGTRYYDLNRDPIVCPNCGTVFEVMMARARPTAARAVKEEEVADEVEVAEEGAELVSLEEADEESADTGAIAVEVDDEEIADDDADDTFLEEEDEDEGDDVSDIIGDVDDDEER